MSPWWSDLLFDATFNSYPAVLASSLKWKIPSNICTRFCDFFQSHLQSFSSRDKKGKNAKSMKSDKAHASCAETAGQESSSTRSTYTATANRTRTWSLASSSLRNAVGKHCWSWNESCKWIHYRSYIQHAQLLSYQSNRKKENTVRVIQEETKVSIGVSYLRKSLTT